MKPSRRITAPQCLLQNYHHHSDEVTICITGNALLHQTAAWITSWILPPLFSVIYKDFEFANTVVANAVDVFKVHAIICLNFGNVDNRDAIR